MTGGKPPLRAARPECAEECRRVLLEIFAAKGGDAHVTWAPPLFATGYEPLNMRCPHGVLWFAEPTAEQRLAWGERPTYPPSGPAADDRSTP